MAFLIARPVLLNPSAFNTRAFTSTSTSTSTRTRTISRNKSSSLSRPFCPLCTSAKGEQLVFSAMIGDVHSVTRLLSEGVSPSFASTRNNSQMTALMWAASEGHTEIARLLLSKGAHVNAKNASGKTALLYALENMPSANPSPPPPPGFPGIPGRDTLGKQSAQIPVTKKITGHTAVLKMLVANAADINVRNEFNENVLHLCARKARDECLDMFVMNENKQLLEHVERFSRQTPLHYAAKENHPSTVKCLLRLGASVDARDVFEWTPLLHAAACGNVQCVAELIRSGADVNATGRVFLKGDWKTPKGIEAERRTTPLQEARKSATAHELCPLLVRHGAL